VTGPAAPAADAPFRPRRGRVVPLGVALVFLVICAVVAVAMGAGGAWGVGDQLALVGFGALVAGFLSRYAAIRATPGPEGLTVRNLMTTRTVGWDEIVDVRFPDGDPWVSLELSDTDVLAVMAVQRVDGEDGRAEARRLAGLVAARRGVSG
jgi:hypothetical protein